MHVWPKLKPTTGLAYRSRNPPAYSVIAPAEPGRLLAALTFVIKLEAPPWAT